MYFFHDSLLSTLILAQCDPPPLPPACSGTFCDDYVTYHLVSETDRDRSQEREHTCC